MTVLPHVPSVHNSERGSTRHLSSAQSPPPLSCQPFPSVLRSHPSALLTTLLFPQERFVDLYGNDAAAEVRKGQETFNKWLLTGATVAGVLLLGSLLSRK